MNAIELNLFHSRITAVCDEMGTVLRRTAFSPNIKDRLDFSCAVFDPQGHLCAQAAHIPVHLGSMAYAMRHIVNDLDWRQDDMLVLNDPFLGGTHLPDVTLIAPVFDRKSGRLAGFVANRAHHADIGCDSPGSMPVSRSLHEEGRIIPPTFLYREGELQRAALPLMSSQPGPELDSDFAAQCSSNRTGVARLRELVENLSLAGYLDGLVELNDYADRLAGSVLAQLKPGSYRFSDLMDDDGAGHRDIKVSVTLKIAEDCVVLDFSESANQVPGNLNCPESVAAAAAFYAFRCLMPEQTPACDGAFRRVQLVTREGSLLNANRPAAVAAGNVETSTRLVDVILGALAQAQPDLIPAASQGSMNNVAMGHIDGHSGTRWDYYETLAGGTGAGPHFPGLNAVHSHMTNTLNTPVESLEMHYPLRVRRYALRQGSGGAGNHAGGEGVIREYEFLSEATVSLLTERRFHQPWGLAGGGAGAAGVNRLNGRVLQPKCTFQAQPGDRLEISTPGGGGYGADTHRSSV
ncbi:MAG: hydantoinase B/oxoprolinase family protein [Gammaproteobacteria bacterium]|nr:hydantoinase B/oxoprolinase family protein [Gammaproteobacteria bacterium]